MGMHVEPVFGVQEAMQRCVLLALQGHMPAREAKPDALHAEQAEGGTHL